MALSEGLGVDSARLHIGLADANDDARGAVGALRTGRPLDPLETLETLRPLRPTGPRFPRGSWPRLKSSFSSEWSITCLVPTLFRGSRRSDAA